MNLEFVRTELAAAQQAEVESDDQLRCLGALIDRSTKPDSGVTASDCVRVITAALALNKRLRERTRSLAADFRLMELEARLNQKQLP